MNSVLSITSHESLVVLLAGAHSCICAGLVPIAMYSHWSLVTGHWSLVTGHWSLVTGHWSLVTGHWSLVIHACPGRIVLSTAAPTTTPLAASLAIREYPAHCGLLFIGNRETSPVPRSWIHTCEVACLTRENLETQLWCRVAVVSGGRGACVLLTPRQLH